MAAGNFDACMEVIFKHEGGYVDHPSDPGGATKFGITHRTLAAHRNVARVSKDDVKRLTKAEAAVIYREDYWGPMQCERLPRGVDLEVMDFGVNAGPTRAIRKLQEALGVEVDGRIGQITMRAAANANPQKLVEKFSDLRMQYYRSLRHWDTFGNGWTRRTRETLAVAQQMASVASGRHVRPDDPGAPSRPSTTGGFWAAVVAWLAGLRR